MGIFFVVFEVICIMVSWLFAKRIVKERWLGAKRMLWAEDETMDINEMRQIAECIFNDEKANVKNCSVTRKFEDEIITEVIVETERKKFSYKFLKLYSKFLSVKKIHEKINKEATKYNQGKKSYITNFGSYYSTRKETFPSFVYGEPKYVKFEDAEFPVPNNYDYVLTTIYGDYMKLPKESDRQRHL